MISSLLYGSFCLCFFGAVFQMSDTPDSITGVLPFAEKTEGRPRAEQGASQDQGADVSVPVLRPWEQPSSSAGAAGHGAAAERPL